MLTVAVLQQRFHGQQRDGNTTLAVDDAGGDDAVFQTGDGLLTENTLFVNRISVRHKGAALFCTGIHFHAQKITAVFHRCPNDLKTLCLCKLRNVVDHAVDRFLVLGSCLKGTDVAQKVQIFLKIVCN